MEINSKNKIFLVGVGRSGTTLLQSMLHTHSKINFLPEINYIRRFLNSNILEYVYQKKGKTELLKYLYNDEFLKRLKLEISDYEKIFQKTYPTISSIGIYEGIIKHYFMGIESLNFVGDKDPRSVEYLPVIKRYFPDAYIIHIIRDPRDVLLSKKKANWSKGRYVFKNIFANRIQYKLGAVEGNKLFKQNYCQIVYENLLKNPESELKLICKFLKLSFESSMLEFQNSSTQLVQKEELQWKKEALGPLLKNNTGKWKNELTQMEIHATENFCSDTMRDMNYPKSEYRNISGIFWGSLFKLLNPIVQFLDLLYTFNRIFRLKA